MTTILVVDDDPSIMKTVSAGLAARAFDVVGARSGGDALEILVRSSVDVVLLDLGLPDIDGIDVVRRIRNQSGVPIIVLSADGSDTRKVLALELGADDYVTKPFSMAELVARVRVAVRHGEMVSGDGPVLSVITVGDLELDLARHRCTVGGRLVDLTPKEFSLLTVLARRPGRLVAHRMLLQEVWGHVYSSETHYLRVYVSQLRKKIGDAPTTPRITSESGVGYRMELSTS